ncbi:MAG: 4-hydroxy-tetrahydrodipicolinate synthase [Gemmatimonadetes bacterium]|nr:4-hydroxy-tetrahydrodipicolinate synthase [Gemmatimonadota bacterium]
MGVEASRFRGVGPALITPMRADGSVDLDAFAEHARFCIDGGVQFLVPCGTTGESATMDGDEQARVIERCVEVAAGRVPVMAGAGTNSTAEACARARAAAAAGADAILSVTPYYNKPTAEGLYRHYMEVAEAARVPVFVYNVPARTGSNVPPETLLRIAEGHELIAGVKEASGDVQQLTTILMERPDGFVVLSGEDYLTFTLVALGGDGAISVVANEAPASMAEMTEAALAGDLRAARALHYRLLPLMRANFVESNPIPVKTALELMGRGKAHFRGPLCELSAEHLPTLRKALELAGIELGATAPRAALR